MNPIKILAAIDRFPEDDAVLVRGMEIAAHHGVALSIVHIVDLPDHVASPALITTFRGQAEFAARDRTVAALRRHGINLAAVEIYVDTGVPAERLVEVCKELKPALVVMRAHHKPWIVEKLLGSTSEKIIGAGHAPVLVVGQSVDKPYGRMLLAIDGPDAAPGALSLVTGLLPETEVHMVQAVAIGPQLEQAMLRVGLAHRDIAAHHDVLTRDAEARLGALAKELRPRVTWQVLRGEPAFALSRATHDPDVDLIALGPSRSGLLQRLFVGGVTRQLLRNAGCDVLIARPPGAGVPEVLRQHEPTASQSTNPLPPFAI